MNLFFGSFVTTVSTILVLSALFFIIFTLIKQRHIEKWGRRVAFLALFGLLVCCFVAARDNYHLSVQASFDDSITAGIFTIKSIQSTLCCIGGAIIALSSISCIFIKNQKYRKIAFMVQSFAVVFKILVIEISRGVL